MMAVRQPKYRRAGLNLSAAACTYAENYVTHDQMEKVTLATKIIVFRNGVIELFGSR